MLKYLASSISLQLDEMESNLVCGSKSVEGPIFVKWVVHWINNVGGKDNIGDKIIP